MKKLNVTELSKELVGKEISFMELDNFMVESGYVSEGGNGIGEHIQNDENVVYMADDTEEYEVQIFFEVLESDEERSDIFTLKVTSVGEF